MPEIITEIKQLTEGQTFEAGADDYLITEEHSITDVLRLLVTMAGNDKTELEMLLADL